VYDIRTQEEVISDNLSGVQFSARMMIAFGILALLLAGAGIYAVISYSVAQRTHEIGVRMALGARQSDVLKMVMSQGLRLTAIGLGIGLCAALGAARLLAPLLYGIGANDPLTMIAVAVTLAAIALSACYLPARKAMRVDPSVALRYE